MMAKIYNLIRILWPRRREEKILNPEEPFAIYEKSSKELKESEYDDDKVEKLYELSKYLFEEEEQRKLNTERKAANCLSAITIASALVVGLMKDNIINLNNSKGFTEYVLMFFCLLLLIYLLFASINALRVFKQENRYYIGPNDLEIKKSELKGEYVKRISLNFIDYTTKNYKINNRVLDIASVSVQFLRNAVVSLILIGIVIIVKNISR